MHELIAPNDTTFGDEESRILKSLRARYQDDHDFFSSQERAHLRFLRWLVRTRHLDGERSFSDVLATNSDRSGGQ
jgi:hypothetical protein